MDSDDRDIEFLLGLYEKEYVKGEKHRAEYKLRIKHESKRKNRHLILDGLLNEAEILNLNKDQIKLVRYLIDDFTDEFQILHRRASEECIILAFMFYVKIIESPRIKIGAYSISNKYNLTNQVFETIVCRMLLKFMKRCPIKPTKNYTKDEHDILIREGRR